MVINPSVYDFVRTREAHRNSATTTVVPTIFLRTDVFAGTRLCRFASWVWRSFTRKVNSVNSNILQMVVEEINLTNINPTWLPHGHYSTKTSITFQITLLQKIPRLSIVRVRLGNCLTQLTNHYFLFLSTPPPESTGEGSTLLQAHRPSNDEHLIGNLTRKIAACHSLFLRSSPVLAQTLSHLHWLPLGLGHFSPACI
jgi:hypothetical protein